jgi:SAM-dependent methyltransferase
MLGLRHSFTYVTCADCGCVQLFQVPHSLSPYYPSAYYSMRPRSALRKALFRVWARESFGYSSLFGQLLVSLMGRHQGVEVVNRLNVSLKARILDVGCGSGDLLFLLSSLGFEDLTGVDPFLAESLVSERGLKVIRGELSSVQGPFDLIMFNHSLEHVTDPLSVLSETLKLLAPGGSLVIRIPIVGTYAWRKYGVNWVGLDPPRHIFVPTERSLRLLAERFSLNLVEIKYESDEFMFWGSEQYQRDIPLNDPRSYATRRLWRLFPNLTMRNYKREAFELNRKGDSDAACFVFRRMDLGR